MTTVGRMLGPPMLVAALVGCQVSREADADPADFTLGKEFTLGGGQEAVSSADDLYVRFTEVLEDSRCPSEVECFWTGQARVAVEVRPAGQPTATAEFNTNPAPGQTVQTTRVDDYTISLTSLEPYPRVPDEPIAFGDYRATLLLRRQ